MRMLVLMTGFATALLAASAGAQQNTAPQQVTLTTMHATTAGAAVKQTSLAAPASITEDAQIMASPVRADPAASVAIVKPDDYKATGEPLRIAPYAMGLKMEGKLRDRRK